MTLRDVQKLLNAEILCGEDHLDREVTVCFACDLISEMLLYVTANTLLITSLTNAHILHTAQVMDALAVVFVTGKRPDAAIIKNSELSDIPLMSTPNLTFDCCGILYKNGVVGVNKDP